MHKCLLRPAHNHFHILYLKKTASYENRWAKPLAIEYFPQIKLPVCAESQPLAIEYFPESKVPICREVRFNAPTVTNSDADPPSMGGRINPPNDTHRKRINNYQMHLYGWTVWWERVTKLEKTPASDNTKKPYLRAKQSEVEKAKFVAKFYTRLPRIETRSNFEMSRPEKIYESKDGDPRGTVQQMLSGCTQKRGRENDLALIGDTESPSKITRFWVGGHRLKNFEKQSD